ncbi:MAG: lysophospholipid acyltransferase family protein, partial [Candidatus Omnitrophica bacterium]|nr:lysophospholipid acyltransferase family protein [Candidatus Omnitrophota bacterium]
MDFKKIRKALSRFLGWLGLNICSLIIKVLPARFLYGFAKAVSSLAYLFAKKQKNIAFESLKIAFGREKEDKELNKIVRECFDYIAKSAVELMFLMDKPKLLVKRVDIIGRENLEAALSKNKGVILVSAHFGNFPLLLGRLALEGYKTAGIMRPMRDLRVEKIFFKKRQKFGVKTIYSQPRDVCVNNTIQSLRNNELVFIPIDQNFGTSGVFVNFFGRKAATATGPVIFAQRTGASLIPCFILRQKDDRHKIIFEPALELQYGKAADETILINIQRLTVVIEAYI